MLSGTLSIGMLLPLAQPGFAQSGPVDAGQAAAPQHTGQSVAPTRQPAPNVPDTGGDIIVTANRREELAQKVGVSITAVTGATIDQHNVRTAEDLGRLVPGLNATSATGTGVSTIVIRGVGETDFSDHQEQPNATYQDGAYVPFSTAVGIPLFDLQRIEALRGPQGTLFGRNATGGLVQYISNKPIAGLAGAVEGAIGDRDLRRVQGFLNEGNDKIAGRLAYYYSTQHGIIANDIGADHGNKRVYALRGQVLAKPTDDLTVTLRAEGFNQNGTSPGYKAMPSYTVDGISTYLPANVDAYGTGPGNDLYGYRNPHKGLTDDANDPGIVKKSSRNYTATIQQMLGDASLTSLTSYGKVHSRYREDTDATPLDEYGAGLESTSHDFQEDIRLSGSTDRFRYTLGGFFLDLKGNYYFYNDIKYIPGLPGAREDEYYSLRTQSEAVYGQGEYDLSDKFTAILGGRYTWDQFKFNFQSICTEAAPGSCQALFLGDPVGTGPVLNGLGPLELKQKHGDWSGKAQLNYKPTDTMLLYASASKGLKGAGFNQAASNNYTLNDFKFGPETLYAFEVGEKAQFFDRKVTLNTSAYYYDYHDLQTFLFILNQTQVINRNATAYGGEVELTARPVHDLTGNVGLAYSHFLVRGVPNNINPDGKQRPVNAPRLQLNWGLTKTFEIGPDHSIQFSYFGRYISSVYFNILNSPIIRAPSYAVADLSARFDAKQGWYVAAYLNNAFDKRYITGAFDVTSLGYGLRLYGEPRTFSAAAGVRF